MWICGFFRKWKSRSKTWKELYANSIDLWIFYNYSSNGSHSLETFIMQVDVDLWIFWIQYIRTVKLKETDRRAVGICGSFFVDLSYVIELVVQNDVHLLIVENMKIKVQKVEVTVRNMLGICGFSNSTHLRVLLVKNH